jgi:phytoene dehydrogenase-like protein
VHSLQGLWPRQRACLSQIDADLQIMYRKYTLAAVDLAHISAEVLRYRVTIIAAIESSTKKEFEQLTTSLADHRARIQHAVDRYAAVSLRASRSGRSEPQDLQAVQQSLDAYFSAAGKTITLLVQSWSAETPDAAAALRHQAELHAADNAGPKLIQVTLALDRLLETVTDAAKDFQNEGTRILQNMSPIMISGWESHYSICYLSDELHASAVHRLGSLDHNSNAKREELPKQSLGG